MTPENECTWYSPKARNALLKNAAAQESGLRFGNKIKRFLSEDDSVLCDGKLWLCQRQPVTVQGTSAVTGCFPVSMNYNMNSGGSQARTALPRDTADFSGLTIPLPLYILKPMYLLYSAADTKSKTAGR